MPDCRRFDARETMPKKTPKSRSAASRTPKKTGRATDDLFDAVEKNIGKLKDKTEVSQSVEVEGIMFWRELKYKLP